MNVWAPGRVNLIGEHTDYSGGLVLPIAIQLGITLTFEPADDVEIIVLDSGERHALEHSGYADRRRELEAGDPRRVRHVESENERVRAAVGALERGDRAELGALFAASHASLRDDYEVSTPALDTLVQAALDAGAFAARLTGGGLRGPGGPAGGPRPGGAALRAPA